MKNILVLILMFPLMVGAQSLITLKDVIDTTLKNNFDIQIARNNLLKSQKMNSFGMAGGMPYLTLSASDYQSINDVYQKYSTGTDYEASGINQNMMNGGIYTGITIFNGFKVMAAKKRLGLQEKQEESMLNYEIQSAVASVMIKYYDIIRMQYYLNIMQQLLDVSQKKLDITNTKKEVGMADGTDILQAQIDVNIAAENLKQQQLEIQMAKADLLSLMSSKSHFEFSVKDTITIDHSLNMDTVLNKMVNYPLFSAVLQQVQINEQLMKEASSQRYPSLKFGASYDYPLTDNSKGSTLINRLSGPSAGLTLQVPLYSGGVYKVQRETAVIDFYNAQLQQASLVNSMRTSVYKVFQTYTKNLEQLKVQQESYEMSKKLVDLVVQNFQMNQATILEVKAAQTSYENAGYQLINMQFAAKVAEIQLLSLMYALK